MAKMNKTEALDAARNMAKRNEAVNAVTLNELAQLDCYKRRDYARTLMADTAVRRIDTHDRYLAECEQAFVDMAVAIWGNKERELERKRTAFRRACTGLTVEQAQGKVRDFFASLNLRGARVGHDSLEVRRGGVNSTLYVRIDRDDFEGLRNPDDENQRAFSHSLRVEYSVSGTTYSPAEMALAIKINQELLDAGNELTATMARERIISTWGIPEVAVAAEEAVQQ